METQKCGTHLYPLFFFDQLEGKMVNSAEINLFKGFFSQGVELNWRQEVGECGIHCHPGMDFRYI
jgi:hypothetical protein